VTTITAADGSVREDFRQSTLEGAPLSPTWLAQVALDRAPRLGRHGTHALHVLTWMRDGATIEEMTRQLRQTFPEDFATDDDAALLVRTHAAQHGAG
jgi:hypothetical protein